MHCTLQTILQNCCHFKELEECFILASCCLQFNPFPGGGHHTASVQEGGPPFRIVECQQVNPKITVEWCFISAFSSLISVWLVHQLYLYRSDIIKSKSWCPHFFQKNRTKLTIVSAEDDQDSKCFSFFGKIKETISCF